MLNRILDHFSNPLTIQVHPDLFYFSSRSGSVQLRTFIVVGKGKHESSIFAVGEEVVGDPNFQRIELFQNSELPHGKCRHECLEAFLRYGIQYVHRGRYMIRPLVIVKGAHTLDKLLLGYQHYVLENALTEAGAREVEFE